MRLARRFICFIFFCFLYFNIYPRIVKTIESEYTYYAPETISLEQAKEIALNRAKIQAIADNFGTVISQSNYTIIKNKDNNSTIDFQSIGLSDLRGEWIETIGIPKFTISYQNGMQIIVSHVKGRIREITSSYTSLNVKLLRLQPDIKYESKEFRNNDEFYVYFASPVDGYLSIYLVDNSEFAYCLLPYARQTDGIFKVSANKEYFFFNKSHSSIEDPTIIDEYVMTCGKSPENNTLYIIFSENPFIKCVDSPISKYSPQQLTIQELNTWIAKSRSTDIKMQVINIPFTINP